MSRGRPLLRLAAVLLLITLQLIAPIGGSIPARQRPGIVAENSNPLGLHSLGIQDSQAFPSRIPVQPLAGGPAGSYFDHVVIIIMENEGIDQICHQNPPPCLSSGPSGSTPYLSSLINNYTIGSHYLSLLPTSQPNYVALLSGSLNGCTAASCPANITAPNLVDRFEAAGLSWRAYFENQTLTQGCDINNSPEPYADIHNPFISFQDILNSTARCNNIFRANPNTCSTVTDCVLVNDLSSGSTAPNFMWLTPNDCHNTRSASVCTNGCTSEPSSACLRAGDNYLKSLVPNILNSNTFKTTKSALYITFDEGDGYCPVNNTPTDCIPSVWAGPVAKTGFVSSNLYNHYSFTKTIEANWNLASLASSDANAIPMTEFFKTSSPDLVISSSPPSLSLRLLSLSVSGTSTITITSLNSLSGPVSLSVSTTPAGLSASLNPTTVNLPGGGSASSTLTVTSSAPNNYIATITATGGNTHMAAMTVFIIPPVSTIATDGDIGSSSLGTGGAEKLIQDSTGRMIAAYTDSSGRISLAYANSDPLTGTWSAPVKSPTPTSPYLRPSAVLLSLTSLRIIAEGGTSAGRITDLPVTVIRDSHNNITGFTFGTPALLDSTGNAAYPTAVAGHNGDVLLAWAFKTSTTSQVRSLRWDPATGWKNFAGTSTIPDNATIDSSSLDWMLPSIIERSDNDNVYLLANRLSSGHNLAYNLATWTGTAWTWGTQVLNYETNASTGIEDPVTIAWDPVASLVVTCYGITGTQSFGVFTLNAANTKTHLDTPSLAITERDWGEITVHISTGDYYIYLMNTNTDGGSGTLDYIRHPAGGSWNSTLNLFDPALSNEGLSVRATGSGPTLDLLYAQGSSSPTLIKFGRLSPSNPPNYSVSAVPPSVSFLSGGSAVSNVTLRSLYGFAGTVGLSRTVSPAGLSATLSQSSVTLTSGGTAVVTLTANSSTPGSYTVTITTTSGSITHIIIVPVTVVDVPPTVSFTRSPASAPTGSTITLTITASDSDGSVASLKVSWGDGTTTSLAGTATSASHSYTIAAVYSVYVNATDNAGLVTKSSATTVTITDRPPVARFTFAPSSPVTWQNVVFNATTSSDPDGTVVSYAWNFGDTTTGTGPTVTHAFTSVASFTVTLTVTDDSGSTGNAVLTVIVSLDPAPTWPNGSYLSTIRVTGRDAVLVWSPASDIAQVSNYRVYENGTLLATVSGSNTTYDATGLTPLAHYVFQVQAGNPSGSWSTNGPSVIVFTDIRGDVNHDCLVDIVDLATIARVFGKTVGDPGYNSSADLNSDGIIDIVDLAIVGENFGHVC